MILQGFDLKNLNYQWVSSFLPVPMSFVLAGVENYKTSLQLDKQHHEPINIPLLFTGYWTSFARSAIYHGVALFSKSQMKLLFQNKKIPSPIFSCCGVILGTIFSHPADVLRTRQAATVFVGPLHVGDRDISINKIVMRDGYSGLIFGLEASLAFNLLQHFISQVVVANPVSYLFSFISSTDDVLISFISLAITKILLNPLEVAKKKKENNDTQENLVKTISTIYKTKKFRGLYSGWYLAIPETFCTVVITHFALKLVERFQNSKN